MLQVLKRKKGSLLLSAMFLIMLGLALVAAMNTYLSSRNNALMLNRSARAQDAILQRIKVYGGMVEALYISSAQKNGLSYVNQDFRDCLLESEGSCEANIWKYMSLYTPSRSGPEAITRGNREQSYDLFAQPCTTGGDCIFAGSFQFKATCKNGTSSCAQAESFQFKALVDKSPQSPQESKLYFNHQKSSSTGPLKEQILLEPSTTTLQGLAPLEIEPYAILMRDFNYLANKKSTVGIECPQGEKMIGTDKYGNPLCQKFAAECNPLVRSQDILNNLLSSQVVKSIDSKGNHFCVNRGDDKKCGTDSWVTKMPENTFTECSPLPRGVLPGRDMPLDNIPPNSRCKWEGGGGGFSANPVTETDADGNVILGPDGSPLKIYGLSCGPEYLWTGASRISCATQSICSLYKVEIRCCKIK